MAQGASAFRKNAASSVHHKRVKKTQSVIKKLVSVRPGNRFVAPKKAIAVQCAALQRGLRAEHVVAAETAAMSKLVGPCRKAPLPAAKP